jgi:hypothetical protein
MANVATIEAETVTMRVALMESLMLAEFNRGIQQGIEQGKSEVTSFDISDDCGTRSAVHVLQAKTRRQLSKEIASRNYRRNGDNPGQAFLWTCKLLRAYRNGDGTWQGVCVSSVHYDI